MSFSDPPPTALPGEPDSTVAFYILRISVNGVVTDQPTVRAFLGSSYIFMNLMEGTTYTLDVDAIVIPPAGGFAVVDLDIPSQYVTTCEYKVDL